MCVRSHKLTDSALAAAFPAAAAAAAAFTAAAAAAAAAAGPYLSRFVCAAGCCIAPPPLPATSATHTPSCSARGGVSPISPAGGGVYSIQSQWEGEGGTNCATWGRLTSSWVVKCVVFGCVCAIAVVQPWLVVVRHLQYWCATHSP